MAFTLGIDPGLSGGLCWLGGLLDSSPKVLLPTPTKKVGKAGRVDVPALKAWLNERVRECGPPALIVIEKSQTMREFDAGGGVKKKQGAVQAHTQGFNAGMLVGFLSVFNWAMEEPTPQAWKAAVLSGFGKKDKAAMFAVCHQRFPSLSLRASAKATKDHDGLADAVGLALFGQYRIGNVPT